MGMGAELSAERGETSVRSVERRHPVLAGVDFSRVSIERARRAELAGSPGQEVLVELAGGPVIVSGGSGLGAWTWIGLEPVESDLPLRVAFPVLAALSVLVAFFVL